MTSPAHSKDSRSNQTFRKACTRQTSSRSPFRCPSPRRRGAREGCWRGVLSSHDPRRGDLGGPSRLVERHPGVEPPHAVDSSPNPGDAGRVAKCPRVGRLGLSPLNRPNANGLRGKGVALSKIPVAVLGATGNIGQRFVSVLQDHPTFEIAALTSSERKVGGSLKDFWRLEDVPLAPHVASMELQPLDAAVLRAHDIVAAFSALPSEIAGDVKTDR